MNIIFRPFTDLLDHAFVVGLDADLLDYERHDYPGRDVLAVRKGIGKTFQRIFENCLAREHFGERTVYIACGPSVYSLDNEYWISSNPSALDMEIRKARDASAGKGGRNKVIIFNDIEYSAVAWSIMMLVPGSELHSHKDDGWFSELYAGDDDDGELTPAHMTAVEAKLRAHKII